MMVRITRRSFTLNTVKLVFAKWLGVQLTMRFIGKHKLLTGLIITLNSILVFILTWGLHLAGYLQFFECKAYDWLVRFKASKTNQAVITVVGLTEEDIRNESFNYPVTDRQMADILSRLISLQPRAIGIDIYRDIEVPPGRSELEKVFKDNPEVVAVWKYSGDPSQRIPPPDFIEDETQAGFGNVIQDNDGAVRRGLLFLDDEQGFYSSLSFELAVRYLAAEGVEPVPDEQNPELMRLGKFLFRPLESNDGLYVNMDAAGHQILLDYGMKGDFSRYSFCDVLNDRIAPDKIREGIVLVGITAVSVKDHFPTPIDNSTPGIELNGYIVDQLIRSALHGERHVGFIPGWQEAAWTWLWSILGGCLGMHIRSPWKFGFAAAAGVAFISILGGGAFYLGRWIPLVIPSLSWLLCAVMVTSYVSYREKGDRRLLMQLFGRHVSSEVAETLWQHRDEWVLDRPWSQHITATVLFTDLVDFSRISENMPPEMMVNWLNQYLEAISATVMEHGGMVNKFIGDGVMGVFGVPVLRSTPQEIEQDAYNAVQCALAMRKKLAELNSHWPTAGLPTVGMRIGIHTGPLVAAIVGSRLRVEYTVLGKTVNIASRLESLDKSLMDEKIASNRCRILISGETLKFISGKVDAQFVQSTIVKGRQQPLEVYGIVGKSNNDT